MTTKKTLLIGAASVLLLVGGCHKKAGGQVVAVANGQEITQQELNQEMASLNLPPNADKKAVTAQVLQRIIDRKLMVAKAKSDGLDQSPAYLAQIRRAEDQILLGLYAEKIAKSLPVPDAGAVDKFIADNGTLFAGRKRYTLDQVIFPMTQDPAAIARLRAAKTMDQLVKALQDSGIQFQRGDNMLDTANVPPQVASRIASLPAGEPFIVPQNGQLVASVIRSSEAKPTPDTQAKAAAAELVRRQGLDAALKKQLDAAKSGAKIEYGAGFGPPPKTADAGALPPPAGQAPTPGATPAP